MVVVVLERKNYIPALLSTRCSTVLAKTKKLAEVRQKLRRIWFRIYERHIFLKDLSEQHQLLDYLLFITCRNADFG